MRPQKLKENKMKKKIIFYRKYIEMERKKEVRFQDDEWNGVDGYTTVRYSYPNPATTLCLPLFVCAISFNERILI